MNSGRATKQRNIEQTALKTNLEAADEIARQLRLRDLAGLVVIDFIDMDENRNQRNVERRFKEAMRSDRARIQIGRISPFGLLELSRQRLRPSILEAATEQCLVCHGAGVVRATASSAVHVLRAVEEEGLRERSAEIRVHVPGNIALYILNNKRQILSEIELSYNMKIAFEEDPSLIPPMYTIETLATRDGAPVEGNMSTSGDEKGAKILTEAEDEDQPRRRKRRRKQRGGKVDEETNENTASSDIVDSENQKSIDVETQPEKSSDAKQGKRRRRGRRGGRRRGGRSNEAADNVSEQVGETTLEESENIEQQDDASNPNKSAEEKKPRRRSRSRRRRNVVDKIENTDSDESAGDEMAETPTEKISAGKNSVEKSSKPDLSPQPATDEKKTAAAHSEDSPDGGSDKLVAGAAEPETDQVPEGVGSVDEPQTPPRRRSGWWQR